MLLWAWGFIIPQIADKKARNTVMKFGEHLGANITPEWRKQYIQYEEMKAMLYSSLKEAPRRKRLVYHSNVSHVVVFLLFL